MRISAGVSYNLFGLIDRAASAEQILVTKSCEIISMVINKRKG